MPAVRAALIVHQRSGEFSGRPGQDGELAAFNQQLVAGLWQPGRHNLLPRDLSDLLAVPANFLPGDKIARGGLTRPMTPRALFIDDGSNIFAEGNRASRPRMIGQPRFGTVRPKQQGCCARQPNKD